MKYTLIKDNKPIMRKISKEVDLPLSIEDKDTLDFMLFYLKKSQDEDYARKHRIRAGVGIAAIQLGILKRMFAIYFTNEDGKIVQYQLVNPEIIEKSNKMCALSSGEGCLSVDEEHQGLVHRHYSIKMKAYDLLSNKEVVISATGFEAIVLQHEYDHLNGIFFYDHIKKDNPLNPLENEIIL